MSVGIDTDFLVRLAILEHPSHQRAVDIQNRCLDEGESFALAPQVLGEFVHIVTDARRFENPLSMERALGISKDWWNALEVEQVQTSSIAVLQFLDWMKEYQLGRKRILDTLLAATYLSAGVTRLITGNSADYRIFPGLQLIEI